VAQNESSSPAPKSERAAAVAEFREKFDAVLHQTMYGTMFKAMRKSAEKTPYFNGGRTEQVFGQQLDQLMAEKMGHRDAQHAAKLAALNTLPRK
jgi:peptidoglycan hydrolase FlgJ